MGSIGFIRDPVYNYIEYDKSLEKPVMDTAPMQRLRLLHQLQLSYLVYPGAEHSRFQHSIGVMHLAGLFAKSLLQGISKESIIEGYRAEELIKATRIAGLLHDIGHGPFSHAFEEAIYWTYEHSLNIKNHEEAGYNIIKNTEIKDILEENGLLDIVLQLLSNKQPEEPILKLLRKTVKEWIYPADILDFLIRDSYYTGTREYGLIDYYRLIRLSHASPFEPGNIVLELRARGALASYLRSRIAMFENVYFHPVTLVFNKAAIELLRITDDISGGIYREAINSLGKGDPTKYLSLNDYEALRLASNYRDKDKRISRLYSSIVNRKPLWKLLYEEKYVLSPINLRGPVSILFKRRTAIEFRDRIEKAVREEIIDKGLKYKEMEDFWVAINTLRPVPPLPVGKITFIDISNNITKSIDIPHLLDEDGILFKLLIRVYGPADLKKSPDRFKYVEAVRDAVKKELEPSALGEITM